MVFGFQGELFIVYKGEYSRHILILGDSVSFGPGVEWDRTFAGLMEQENPAWRVYNSSVIAYTTDDYYNVAKSFIPLHNDYANGQPCFLLYPVFWQSSG